MGDSLTMVGNGLLYHERWRECFDETFANDHHKDATIGSAGLVWEVYCRVLEGRGWGRMVSWEYGVKPLAYFGEIGLCKLSRGSVGVVVAELVVSQGDGDEDPTGVFDQGWKEDELGVSDGESWGERVEDSCMGPLIDFKVGERRSGDGEDTALGVELVVWACESLEEAIDDCVVDPFLVSQRGEVFGREVPG